MSIYGDKSDDEYSVIGDKGEIGFLDYGDDKSVCGYNPSDEGPVIISVPFAFEQQRPQSVSVDEVSSNAITIRNTSSESVELWGIQIYASNPADSFTLSLMEPSKPGFKGSSSLEDRVLQPSKTLTVWLSCKPKEIGMHTCVVHFDVGDDKIERVVFVLAEDKISKALASKKPYQRGERKKAQFAVNSYVTGVRPARAPGRPFRHKLPVYEIPKEIRSILEDKQIPDAILGGLSKKNYVPYFRTLLIMEELRLEEDIRAYDMENAIMRSRGRQFLVLEVLGLAERRPSLVHGDSVYVRLAAQCADDTPVYEGYIHRVEADQVYLKFADDFHHRHSDRNSYNIRFMYNRVNMRRLYQATEAAEELPADFLFPSESVTKRQIKPTAIVPISGSLNEEQLNAVKTILGCKGGVPYIINGPPGTGKTRTLVEVVLQLYMSRKNPRILICASSNSAADHILERMLDQRVTHLRENDIIRLNASSRPYEDMNPDYLRFCFEEDGLFKCPPLRTLLRCRIIITTYMSASLLHAEGVKKGNFSHIILDEAGQASEPETMVPISNLWQKDTVIVLAGDPKQLGPVIFSSDAKMHGLAKSYLERLFDCQLYSQGGEGYVTTLLRNYRSHPDILQLPSELFYGGQLIACHEVMKSVPWADLLPNKEFPILFSGVQAYDEREGNNPSWFNRTEASIVVKLVKKLKERKVSEDTIGVITPYRQQVAKIKVALEDAGILNIKIGSVEQFQGQEREVIIVSTVRSTVKHDEFDRIYYLGFLSNPKRFNVAITRAKSLLVIIGNPHIICKDHNWAKLLWRCVDNNSYEGCSLPERQFFNYDNPTEEWSPAPVHETEDWSGAADQESQWGWSDAAVQGGHCEGSGVEQQGLTGGWSDDVGKETQSGWSNAVEQSTEGEWSGSPEQAIKGGWSDAADQESQWNHRDEVQQGTGDGWSESAEQGVNGGWSGDAGQETQWGSSAGGEQDTAGHWSYGVEQGMERVSLGESGQGEQGGWCHAPERTQVGRSHASEVHEGNRPYVEQEDIRGGLSDSAKKGITRGCSVDARQETQWRYSDAGEQGAQGHRSDGVKRGTQGGGFDGSDQGARRGWSHAAGQGIQKVRPHAAEPGVQRGWLHASDGGTQGERSHVIEQGREVIKAEAGYGQEYTYAEDYPKPVKDEDEWSDGWK